MRRPFLAVLLLTALALPIAGCGTEEDDPTSPQAVERALEDAGRLAADEERANSSRGERPPRNARERLNYRLARDGKDRRVRLERDDVVVIDATAEGATSPGDPSDTAVRSIVRSYVRSGYTRALRIVFRSAAFELTPAQIEAFEDLDRAGAVIVEDYRAG